MRPFVSTSRQFAPTYFHHRRTFASTHSLTQSCICNKFTFNRENRKVFIFTIIKRKWKVRLFENKIKVILCTNTNNKISTTHSHSRIFTNILPNDDNEASPLFPVHTINTTEKWEKMSSRIDFPIPHTLRMKRTRVGGKFFGVGDMPSITLLNTFIYFHAAAATAVNKNANERKWNEAPSGFFPSAMRCDEGRMCIADGGSSEDVHRKKSVAA